MSILPSAVRDSYYLPYRPCDCNFVPVSFGRPQCVLTLLRLAFHSITTMALQESPLSRKINRHLTFSRFPKRSQATFATVPTYRFITVFDLQGYFLVHHNIANLNFSQHKPLADYILQHAKELFAISIAIGMPHDLLLHVMTRFMQNGINDAMIPTLDQNINGHFPRIHWRTESDFLRNRYFFRAPMLPYHRRFERRTFDRDRPIPIIDHENPPLEGGFAFVYKVTIHGQFLDQLNQQVRSCFLCPLSSVFHLILCPSINLLS